MELADSNDEDIHEVVEDALAVADEMKLLDEHEDF